MKLSHQPELTKDSRIAIYPGSFDPMTYGHIHLIKRASSLFDHLFVALASQTPKKTTLPLQARLQLAKQILSPLHLPVTVITFDGLLVSCAKAYQAKIIVRGLRHTADFMHEHQMASMNQLLSSNLETLFLMADPQYASISSTLVREVIRLGGDVSELIPAAALKAMQKHNRKIINDNTETA